jgi:hypothetical protein
MYGGDEKAILSAKALNQTDDFKVRLHESTPTICQ